MKDKLLFETTILPNGMKVYSQFDGSVEFAEVSLVAPVGTIHNHGEIIPGSFHFLEHLQVKRSEEHQEKGRFKELISMHGGRFGASTWPEKTSYDLACATEHLPSSFRGLVSHFFYPLLVEDDVRAEAGIIANERNRKSPFYPGTNERTQYLDTKWMHDVPYTVEQVFGSDEDFLKMNPDYFSRLHAKYYKTDKSHCVIAGNFDLDMISRELSAIELERNGVMPQEKFEPRAWARKEFHCVETREANRFEYYAGSIYAINPQHANLHSRMLSIIRAMISDYSYGRLMKWLRHERGWCYDIVTNFEVVKGIAGGGFMIPLNSLEQVHTVRKELQKKIFDGISNPELLERVKDHKRNLSKFWYQTVQSRLEAAQRDLWLYGRIDSEQEYLDTLYSVTTDQLIDVFTKQMLPNFGEMVFVPIK